MPNTLPSDALRLAINALMDVAASRRMPSGIEIDQATADLHTEAAATLQTSLDALVEYE